MKISHALVIAAADAVSAPLAPVATRTSMRPASWVSPIIANVQPAARPVAARPTPRQRKSGRKRSPAAFHVSTSTSAWVASPRVAPPASTASCAMESARAVGPRCPNVQTNTPSIAIATTLFATGAQV